MTKITAKKKTRTNNYNSSSTIKKRETGATFSRLTTSSSHETPAVLFPLAPYTPNPPVPGDNIIYLFSNIIIKPPPHKPPDIFPPKMSFSCIRVALPRFTADSRQASFTQSPRRTDIKVYRFTNRKKGVHTAYSTTYAQIINKSRMDAPSPRDTSPTNV